MLKRHRSAGATPARTSDGAPPLRSSQGWEPRTYPFLWQTALLIAIFSIWSVAQTSVEYHRALQVSNEEPVKLHIEIARADLQVLYDRDGEVSIHAVALATGDAELDQDYFGSTLSIQQTGNDVTVRHQVGAVRSETNPKIRFRINVPYRTEVHTSLEDGTQTLRGLLGPVDARSRKGDIQASYISKEVHAEVERGNLDLQVIGEPVVAKVGVGSISAQRLEKGIQAETNDGDITLMVVGSSTARVTSGTGRIEVGGARGTLTLSTDTGDLRVQAVPHSDWQLQSRLGTIRLTLPEKFSAELEVSSDSGELQVERDDILRDEKNPNLISGRIGAGGKLIAAHTEKGRIVIR